MLNENPMEPAYPSTTFLLIDASAVEPWVGILQSGQWLALHAAPNPALESIFASTEQCLNEAGLTLQQIQEFIHCEGPGSVLGIRLSAMAIRSWRALPQWQDAIVKTYQSLHLIRAIINTQALSEGEVPTPPFHIISPARKGTWNCLSSNATTIQIIDHSSLLQLEGPVHHYQQRKSWHQAPNSVHPFTLDLSTCAHYFYQPEIVTRAEHPALFEAHANTYKKWGNTRHR